MTQLTRQTSSVLLLEPVLARTPRRALLTDFIQLAKPRITLMVVITAWIGYALGQRTAGNNLSEWLRLSAALLGTALSCVGASALNQVYERDTDALMRRTQNRPLPAGRISVLHAGVFAITAALLGVFLLAVCANPLAAAVSAFTILSYVLIYTPLKRVSSLSTVIGAVPGALPPVIGYAAAAGTIGREAIVLFAIMFVWQLPHFLAIAWLYRDDFARARFPVLPVLDPTGASTFRQILVGCAVMLPVGLLPAVLHISGVWYFVGAFLAGLMFLAFGIALIVGRTRAHARAMFLASLVYLPAVLALMVLDRV